MTLAEIGVNLRLANENDIEAMGELDRICFSVPWSNSDFESEITKNKLALYIVAETVHELIGYAGLWAVLDEGHITNIAVHPEYRKLGLGSLLLSTLINHASETASTRSFTLEVRESNEAAINLYKKHGFYKAGSRKNYYSDNRENADIMNMEL